MGRLQGSGARVGSIAKLHRGLAQMSDADYEAQIKRCRLCGKRIALSSGRKYCVIPCRSIAQIKLPILRQAFAARGEWVTSLVGYAKALRLEGQVNHRSQFFQASVDGRRVSVRYIGPKVAA